jgi:DNA-binding NarL/FixJ family response regulator
VVAVLLAGTGSAVAATRQTAPDHTPKPAKVAVLAGSDTDASTIGAIAPMHAAIVHTGGALETQAQAAQLAAEGYDTVIAVGAQARAAVAQAQAGEVGAHTRWQSER